MLKVLLTGGAGYIGSVLLSKLLDRNYEVIVLDKMIYGDDGVKAAESKSNLTVVEGDIRDKELVSALTEKVDFVIHLAAISNDPSAELDEELTVDVNYKGTVSLAKIAKENGVKRFINASTSSVYGIKSEEKVTEDLTLNPLTIYSKTKRDAEKVITESNDDNFTTVSIRSATACGYSPKMRLDLVVNILTSHAIMNRKILVFGGDQKRPNIHIDDLADLYVLMLEAPQDKIAGEVFNVGFENHTVKGLAEMVKCLIGDDVEIEIQDVDDPRSYNICSEKITRILGYVPKKDINKAILDIKDAFESGKISDWHNINYYNVKKMKEIGLK